MSYKTQHKLFITWNKPYMLKRKPSLLGLLTSTQKSCNYSQLSSSGI